MNERELDQLIDRALAAYVVEPEAGLAERVELAVRRQRSPWWLGLAVAAASLAFAFWPSAERLPLAPPALVANWPKPPALALVTRPQPMPRAPVRVREASRPALTREERQLAAFVEAYPVLAAEALVEAPKHLGDPLVIASIEIAPLAESSDDARRIP